MAPRESSVEVFTFLLRDCKFRSCCGGGISFDLRQGPSRCIREVRRHFIRDGVSTYFQPARVESASIGRLEDALLSEPGSVTIEDQESSALAQEFARVCAPDFRAVYWVPCRERTMAQICGELAWQMGELTLDGRLEENLAALQRGG